MPVKSQAFINIYCYRGRGGGDACIAGCPRICMCHGSSGLNFSVSFSYHSRWQCRAWKCSLPKVALETVSMLVWLSTDFS